MKTEKEKEADKKADDNRLRRSMTITINEEEHPLWTEVDAIWEDAKVKHSQCLTADQAKAAITKYLKDDLGLKKIDDHPELTEHMWQEIDGTDKGKVSRDAMFHHLKEARDINIVEDAHTNVIVEEKKPVASILASVPIKKDVAADDSEEAFGEVDEEKKIDARWQKKMKRASTILINEDDHPCWA